jgi:predicted NACHT family NTPase
LLCQDKKITGKVSRAYYFALDLTFDLYRALDRALDLDLSLDLALDLSLYLDFALALHLADDLARDLVRDLTRAKEIGDARLYQRLQALKDQLPDPNRYRNVFEEWWKQNGKEWIAEYCQVIIEHRNIGHDWQFTNEQREKLEQYYEANELLVECLKSDCYVRRETRQEIEESLLLPSKR